MHKITNFTDKECIIAGSVGRWPRPVRWRTTSGGRWGSEDRWCRCRGWMAVRGVGLAVLRWVVCGGRSLLDGRCGGAGVGVGSTVGGSAGLRPAISESRRFALARLLAIRRPAMVSSGVDKLHFTIQKFLPEWFRLVLPGVGLVGIFLPEVGVTGEWSHERANPTQRDAVDRLADESGQAGPRSPAARPGAARGIAGRNEGLPGRGARGEPDRTADHGARRDLSRATRPLGTLKLYQMTLMDQF